MQVRCKQIKKSLTALIFKETFKNRECIAHKHTNWWNCLILQNLYTSGFEKWNIWIQDWVLIFLVCLNIFSPLMAWGITFNQPPPPPPAPLCQTGILLYFWGLFFCLLRDAMKNTIEREHRSAMHSSSKEYSYASHVQLWGLWKGSKSLRM